MNIIFKNIIWSFPIRVNDREWDVAVKSQSMNNCDAQVPKLKLIGTNSFRIHSNGRNRIELQWINSTFCPVCPSCFRKAFPAARQTSSIYGLFKKNCRNVMTDAQRFPSFFLSRLPRLSFFPSWFTMAGPCPCFIFQVHAHPPAEIRKTIPKPSKKHHKPT